MAQAHRVRPPVGRKVYLFDAGPGDLALDAQLQQPRHSRYADCAAGRLFFGRRPWRAFLVKAGAELGEGEIAEWVAEAGRCIRAVSPDEEQF